jgi:hypothetical protein
MRRQQHTQALDKIGLLQLTGADIDAHRDVQSGCAPEFYLGQRGIDNLLAEFDG